MNDKKSLLTSDAYLGDQIGLAPIGIDDVSEKLFVEPADLRPVDEGQRIRAEQVKKFDEELAQQQLKCGIVIDHSTSIAFLTRL